MLDHVGCRLILLSVVGKFFFSFCRQSVIFFAVCQLSVNPCLVPRPHYYARPMRFGSRGPRKFLRRLPAVRLGYVTEMH